MKELFKKKNKPLIGVDISSSRIKMMELSGTAQNITIESYSIESIPDGLYSDHNILDIEKLSEHLKKAWSKLGTSNKSVAIAMPSAMVISKRFEMQDGLTSKDQLSQVESEAESYIPFSLDEVNLDYQILGPSATKEGHVDVYLAVSRKQHVDERLAVVQMAGLNAKVLDIDQMASIHAFEKMFSSHELAGLKDKNIMIVDLGSKVTEYQVLRNMEPIYNREHNMSMSVLKQTITNNYGCSDTEVDHLMRGYDNVVAKYPNYLADILQPFMDGMALEIIRHIQLYESSGIWDGISKIILCGGGAMLDGLDDTVQEKTGIATQIANPMARCKLSNKLRAEVLINDAPSLVVPFGLALRSFV